MTPKVELATFKDYTTDLYGLRRGNLRTASEAIDDPIKITKIRDDCLFGYLCNLLLPLFLSLKKKPGIYVENSPFHFLRGKSICAAGLCLVLLVFVCASSPCLLQSFLCIHAALHSDHLGICQRLLVLKRKTLQQYWKSCLDSLLSAPLQGNCTGFLVTVGS